MSYSKSVKGATKIKLAAPKSKYTEHLVGATRNGESAIAEVVRLLQDRIRDPTWTTAFKALIVLHMMIREGQPDVTLDYLAGGARKALVVASYTDIQTQGRNIRHYATYLSERSRCFARTRQDPVVKGSSRMKGLTVDKGLLMETETIQEQIKALLKCDFLTDEMDNEITLTAFRMLTMDLLALYEVMNEGVINVLEHYFEMSRPDAERALLIYQAFAKQTDQVVQFLNVARRHEHVTRLEVPKIRHAPTSLTSSLEEYLHDQDFETNRTQFLAEKEGKKNAQSKPASYKPQSFATAASVKAFVQSPSPASAPSTNVVQQRKPETVDFFGSIDPTPTHFPSPPQIQQPYYSQPAPGSFLPTIPQHSPFSIQAPTFAQNLGGSPQISQSFDPFGQYQQPQQTHQPQQMAAPPLQTQFTGAGFGGYSAQPQQYGFDNQQNSDMYGMLNGNTFQPQFSQPPQVSQQPQQTAPQTAPQTSNPFRQSMMVTGQQQGTTSAISTQMTGTNPFAFANTNTMQQQGLNQPSSFGLPETQHQTSQVQAAQPLYPQQTGTNPFARGASASANQQQDTAPVGAVLSHATGSTNPFRQSAFVNQQTGQGWQAGPQGSMGGLEQLSTIPVFPRPGQSQQQHSPWGL